ncbi:MAG TPA: hypothetical protein VFG41_04395 [Sphingomicrobium sp.]|nr:hypothetical protein [Sphingomicrobium sp.]
MTTWPDSPATDSSARVTHRWKADTRPGRTAGTGRERREAKLQKFPRRMRILIFLGLSIVGWTLLGLGAVFAFQHL